MATTNTFIKPSVLARTALATLYSNTVLLPLVTRDYDPAFVAGIGDTINVRKPATLTALDYNQAVGILPQNITETSVPVKMDQIADVSVEVTSLQMTQDIVDFAAEVLQPAMEAMAQKVDKALSALFTGFTTVLSTTAYNASTNPHPTFDLIKAGRVLSSNNVPFNDRVAVVDEYLAAQWRMDALSHEADKRADDGTALRDAEIARMHGFDNYESNNIDNFYGAAFHRSALAFVSRPMVLPRGAAYATVENYKGLGLRVIWDYDPQYKKELLSIDLLYGTKLMDANRGLRFFSGSAS